MSTAYFSRKLLLSVVLLTAASAIAANGGSHNADLQISRPVTVAGTQLAAGDYSLAWEGNGPDIELNILKGRKVIAKTPARIVVLDHANANGGNLRTNNPDGTESLAQIFFSGKKYALAISEDASAKSAQGTH